jgi:hypothetical protein
MSNHTHSFFRRLFYQNLNFDKKASLIESDFSRFNFTRYVTIAEEGIQVF